MTLLVLKGRAAIDYLSKIDPILYLIVFFCLAGFLRNILALSYFGFTYSTVATRALTAMALIYFAQIILIFMRRRIAWFVSAIQCFFCFYVYEDFTAIPFANMLKMILASWLNNADYGWVHFYSMTVLSAMFSIELLKTYLIYALTDQPASKKKAKQEKTIPLIQEQL